MLTSGVVTVIPNMILVTSLRNKYRVKCVIYAIQI